MRKLYLIALIIAALEIALFILIGKQIGILYVFVLIIASALIGVSLAKKHGQITWAQAQQQMLQGQVPGTQVFDGLCILIGGILLIIPGFLTDIIGLLFVLPFTRSIFKRKLQDKLREKMNAQTIIYRR